MKFEDLPKDAQHDIQTGLFRMELDADETDRRWLTAFGYNHGKLPGFFIWLFAPVAAAVFTIIGLVAFYFPNQDTSLGSSSVVWWLTIPPFALMPVTTFLFYKPRYAVAVLGIVIGVLAVLLVMLAGFYALIGSVV